MSARRPAVDNACVPDAETALGFTPEVTITGPVNDVVAAEVGADLVATLREALSNVARHAAASRALVTITVSPIDGAPHVALTVTDDGIGLQAQHVRGNGLTNMGARADRWQGEFAVRKSRLGGTRLEWTAPLPARPGATA